VRPGYPGPRPPSPGVCRKSCCTAYIELLRAGSSCLEAGSLALALLVARVLADHNDVALATNHLALITDPLDARLDLHGYPLRLQLSLA
jgi:hypothetical protein